MERAVELRPLFGELRRGLGMVELHAARQRMLRGRSPAVELAAAERELDAALEAGYDDAETLRLLAEVSLWGGRWEQGRGRPATETFQEGLKIIGEALEINPRLAEGELLRGELGLSLAGNLIDTEETEQSRQRAQAAFRKAQAINPLLERVGSVDRF